MTLANFNNEQVETFVSTIFDSKIPTSSKMNNQNTHYPQPPNQPSFGNHGTPYGGPAPNNYHNQPNYGYPHPPNNNMNNANFNPPSSLPMNSTPNFQNQQPSPQGQQFGNPQPQYHEEGVKGKGKTNIQDMDDQEFEGALDDFIKGLKDI
jgi:hypothetical protein